LFVGSQYSNCSGIDNAFLYALCRKAAGQISKLQTGYIYHYALSIVLGLIILIFFLISSFKKLMVF